MRKIEVETNRSAQLTEREWMDRNLDKSSHLTKKKDKTQVSLAETAIQERIKTLDVHLNDLSSRQQIITLIHTIPEATSTYVSQRSKEERKHVVDHLQSLMKHGKVQSSFELPAIYDKQVTSRELFVSKSLPHVPPVTATNEMEDLKFSRQFIDLEQKSIKRLYNIPSQQSKRTFINTSISPAVDLLNRASSPRGIQTGTATQESVHTEENSQYEVSAKQISQQVKLKRKRQVGTKSM